MGEKLADLHSVTMGGRPIFPAMTYIVISGLPASGKSSLARQLAPRLDLPILDKDDILSALLDSLGIGDAEWRRRLSRAADDVFARTAATLGASILVSWWRHPNAANESGTPTAWLTGLTPSVVEIHCLCPPHIAASRFVGRTRHPGHLDSTRRADSLTEEFERHSRLGPLGLGPLICADTAGDIAFDDLVAFVHQHKP